MTAEKILEVIKKQLEEDSNYYLKIGGDEIGLYAVRLLFAIIAMEEEE